MRRLAAALGLALAGGDDAFHARLDFLRSEGGLFRDVALIEAEAAKFHDRLQARYGKRLRLPATPEQLGLGPLRLASACAPLRADDANDPGEALERHFRELADVVVEAQKPGALASFGLGYDVLKEINPSIVFATLSGYGSTGPYRDMPSHGIAYDTWAGIVQPVTDDDGFTRIPKDMPNVGINVGPMVAAEHADRRARGSRERAGAEGGGALRRRAPWASARPYWRGPPAARPCLN